jgi:hypothetical protein
MSCGNEKTNSIDFHSKAVTEVTQHRDVFEQLPQKPMYNYVNFICRAVKKHRAYDFFPLSPPNPSNDKKRALKKQQTEKIKTTCSICFNTAGHINKNRGCVL